MIRPNLGCRKHPRLESRLSTDCAPANRPATQLHCRANRGRFFRGDEQLEARVARECSTVAADRTTLTITSKLVSDVLSLGLEFLWTARWEHYVEKMFRRRESMSTARRADSGAAEGARRATEQSAESGPLPGAGRWSARRKVSVILELLRGADLEST